MCDDKQKGRFKAINIIDLQSIGMDTIIPESDLTIQTNDKIVQYKYIEPEDERYDLIFKPGCFAIVNTSAGAILKPFNLRDYNLLKTIDNTSIILQEASKFFSRVHVYEQLKRDPKRAILLCSDPGVGKSAAINEVCKTFLNEEGTVVMIWDTTSISATAVNKMFLLNGKFREDVKKLILVIEDIDGGSIDQYSGGPRGADSSLLNLLDGVGQPFQNIPTFIISTTNNPETSVQALIDRPGRFDKVMTLKTPDEKECVDLLKFIKETDSLTEDEYKAAELASKSKFSIAHIQECVVRSMLDDVSVLEATLQLIEHKKKFKEGFRQAANKMGL